MNAESADYERWFGRHCDHDVRFRFDVTIDGCLSTCVTCVTCLEAS